MIDLLDRSQLGGAMWIFLTAVFLVMVWLLYKFPRKTLKIGGIIIGVLCVVGGAFFYNEHLESEQRKRDQQSVKITLKYDADCPKGYPLRVIIRNGSRRTLESVRWDIEAYRPGYSTNLVGVLERDMSSDFILRPAKAASACYPIPKLTRTIADASKLEYRASRRYVSFAAAEPSQPKAADNDPLGIR